MKKHNWRTDGNVDITDRDALVHALCPMIEGRAGQECLGCPEWEQLEMCEEPLKRMCYGLAEEVINIVQTGNPWGKK